MKMAEGVVKWFDVKKGYGFLVSPEVTDDAGKSQDVFVHYSKIEMEGFKKLEAGETVTFTLVRDPQGRPQADAVVRQAAPETPEREDG
jgi:CspA family cold shock protein